MISTPFVHYSMKSLITYLSFTSVTSDTFSEWPGAWPVLAWMAQIKSVTVLFSSSYPIRGTGPQWKKVRVLNAPSVQAALKQMKPGKIILDTQSLLNYV
jgi:hypothetical protein